MSKGFATIYEQLLEITQDMSKLDPTQTPSWKAMLIVAEMFYQYGIPRKYAALIDYQLDSSFFEHQDNATEVVKNFSLALINIWKAVKEEFGSDAEEVFEKMITKMQLKAQGSCWRY